MMNLKPGNVDFLPKSCPDNSNLDISVHNILRNRQSFSDREGASWLVLNSATAECDRTSSSPPSPLSARHRGGRFPELPWDW